MVNILISGKAAELECYQKLGETVRIVFHEDERKAVPEPDCFQIAVCNSLFQYNDISLFKDLRFIQLTSSGMDRVPVGYIQDNGIRLCNAKGVYDIPIAEYAIGRILQWYKKFNATDELMAQSGWEKQRKLQELNNKKALIYGYGGIGYELAKRLKSFNVYLIGVSRTKKHDGVLDEWIEAGRAKERLKEADIVIFTVPFTDETNHLADDVFFDSLNPGCLVVNVSRGGIIKTEALINALNNGKICGAVLDVFEEEPLAADSILRTMDNVLLSPHNSFEGEGNQSRLEQLIINNLQAEITRLNTVAKT